MKTAIEKIERYYGKREEKAALELLKSLDKGVGQVMAVLEEMTAFLKAVEAQLEEAGLLKKTPLKARGLPRLRRKGRKHKKTRRGAKGTL